MQEKSPIYGKVSFLVLCIYTLLCNGCVSNKIIHNRAVHIGQPVNSDLENKNKNLIVIDTDCGVDDVMAILLALSDKEHTKVLAISCIAGNTILDNVCKNAMRILVLSKEKKIPIYRGSERPLVFPGHSDMFFGSDGLYNISEEFPLEDMQFQSIPSAIALTNLAKMYPKRISLVALGPLTNVALAHRLDPEFTRNLKELVVLGGNYKGMGNVSPAAEFNFYFDPEAAHVVMAESLCPVKMVPWETVLDCGMKWEHIEELIEKISQHKSEKSRFLQRILSKSYSLQKEKKFHDSDLLAVAAAIRPESVFSEIYFPVTVECSGKYTRGQAVIERKSQKGKQVNIITKFSNDIIDKLWLKLTE